MGVKRLWNILDAAGEHIELDQLDGQVLAVDTSMLMYRLVKGYRNEPWRIVLGFLSHLGVFIRFGIAPVFVFDGQTPFLKTATMEERKRIRKGNTAGLGRIAKKLLQESGSELAAAVDSESFEDDLEDQPFDFSVDVKNRVEEVKCRQKKILQQDMEKMTRRRLENEFCLEILARVEANRAKLFSQTRILSMVNTLDRAKLFSQTQILSMVNTLEYAELYTRDRTVGEIRANPDKNYILLDESLTDNEEFIQVPCPGDSVTEVEEEGCGLGDSDTGANVFVGEGFGKSDPAVLDDQPESVDESPSLESVDEPPSLGSVDESPSLESVGESPSLGSVGESPSLESVDETVESRPPLNRHTDPLQYDPSSDSTGFQLPSSAETLDPVAPLSMSNPSIIPDASPDLHNIHVQPRYSTVYDANFLEELKHLLDLFGFPVVSSPMEADSQCAYLANRGLVDGIVSDDSDMFLYSQNNRFTIYRHFFNKKKPILRFTIQNIGRCLNLNKDKLLMLAYLLGSDYNRGVSNVGPVLALEILGVFYQDSQPVLASLTRFREWLLGKDQAPTTPKLDKWRHKQSSHDLPFNFPDHRLLDLFVNPPAKPISTKFRQKAPKPDQIEAFFRYRFKSHQAAPLDQVSDCLRLLGKAKRCVDRDSNPDPMLGRHEC